MGCERLLTEIANIAYDLFEAVVEIGIDTISSILLRMEMEGSRLFLTICADCTEDLTALTALFPEIVASQDEDGLWYLSREVSVNEFFCGEREFAADVFDTASIWNRPVAVVSCD